jgi:hypothetical protein
LSPEGKIQHIFKSAGKPSRRFFMSALSGENSVASEFA